MRYSLTGFQQWLLRIVAEDAVIQSHHHQDNIKKYYQIVYNAAKEEFNEDNDITLKSLLLELFMKSINADRDYILKMLDASPTNLSINDDLNRLLKQDTKHE